MLKIAIVDANDTPNKLRPKYSPIGVVSHWLVWEMQNALIEPVAPDAADIILFCYSGAIGWKQRFVGAARHLSFDPLARGRHQQPYIIAGGQIDTIPTMAVTYADALAVGEAFFLVRELLQLIRSGKGIEEIDRWLTDYPHAITSSQYCCQEDKVRPYLLDSIPATHAIPDYRIDWNIPPIRCADKVARVVVSKGCRMKCKFCATSYRQEYAYNDNAAQVVGTSRAMRKAGQRLILVSNDVADLPYYDRLVQSSSLQVQSLSYRAITSKGGIRISKGMKNNMVRIGVEGLSERLRVACGKPISDTQLIECISSLHSWGVKTHLFFIGGLPFETEDDYESHKALLSAFASEIDRCIMRIKYTTFNPTPPSPLTRFIQGKSANERSIRLREWFFNNAASRHMMLIRGKSNVSWRRDVAELLDIESDYIDDIQGNVDTIDLAPMVEDYARMKHNIIQWPIRASTRWRLGNKYQERLQDMGLEPRLMHIHEDA